MAKLLATEFVSKLESLNSCLETGFQRYSSFLIRRNAVFVLFPLVLSTLMSFGFLNFEKLNRDDNFLTSWLSSESKVILQNHKMETAFFGNTFSHDIIDAETCSVYLELKGKNESVFTDTFVTDYLWLRNALETISVAKSEGKLTLLFL